MAAYAAHTFLESLIILPIYIDFSMCDVIHHHPLFVETQVQHKAPFLFSLYTSDCKSTESACLRVKIADDTDMVGQICKRK